MKKTNLPKLPATIPMEQVGDGLCNDGKINRAFSRKNDYFI